MLTKLADDDVMTSRVRRVLRKKPEPLVLPPAELRTLVLHVASRVESGGDCSIDPSAARDDEERALLLTIQRRLDEHGSDTKAMRLSGADRKLRARLRSAKRRNVNAS